MEIAAAKMNKLSQEKRLTIQFFTGLLVVVAGLVLLFLGFYAVPLGEIAPSVLTAFGETATFAGALIGIDYKYKFEEFKIRKEDGEKEESDPSPM